MNRNVSPTEAEAITAHGTATKNDEGRLRNRETQLLADHRIPQANLVLDPAVVRLATANEANVHDREADLAADRQRKELEFISEK